VVTTGWNEDEAMHGLPGHEVVRRPGIEEGKKAFPLDGDGQQHGISRPNACNSLKRNHEGISCGWRVGILVGRQAILDIGYRLIVEVVFALQVEEPLAHMAANIRLVAVEAQPLTATFLLLDRRQAMKLAHGQGCDGPLGRWRHGPGESSMFGVGN
jgi:hypothetical protein